MVEKLTDIRTPKGVVNNPFTLDSGRIPKTLVSGSTADIQEIIDVFSSETPSYQSCFISGIQGSGKTVSLTFIAEHFQNRDDWLVIELNPEKNMTLHLAAKLCEQKLVKVELSAANISVSIPVLGINIGVVAEGTEPIQDTDVAIEKMLQCLKKKNKKLLIVIDDVFPNDSIRSFAYDFQMLIRLDLPVFLVMTGLYENLQGLQEKKQLSSVSRIPRIHLAPLDDFLMADRYSTVFNIGIEKALSMAKETNGYPFAFQVLGFLTWKYGDDPDLVNTEFKRYLSEYVYDKVWENLSEGNQLFLYAIARASHGKESTAKELYKVDNILFQKHKREMEENGIIKEQEDCLTFALPYFDEFLLKYYE